MTVCYYLVNYGFFFPSVIERKSHEHIKIPKEEKSMRFLHWHSKILNLILKYLNFQSNIFFFFHHRREMAAAATAKREKRAFSYALHC